MDPRRPAPPPTSRPPRPARARGTVEISRAWLGALAGGLLIALLVVAYLMGRESGRRATETVTVDPPAAVSRGRGTPASTAGEAPPPTPQGEASADTRHPPAFWTPEAGAPHTGQRLEEWTSEPDPASAAGPQGTAVAAYFAEIEGYEQQAKYWSNPQELALSLVGQSAQGDTGGMRQLLETQRTAQRQIESMTVPLPCREHHRRTVEMLRRAGELLGGLEGRLASGDIEGLLSLSNEARQLEADTRDVDALAGQIKRQYGLAG